MWIRRLAVAQWRGLDFDLTELSPGLNLIFGANETGKSRLVEALRFAFFESSSGRSAHKKALATWGPTPGRPRVTVEFELAGTAWKLDKAFLGTGCNTTLKSATVSLDGTDAEARLAELMGAGPGGRTESAPEDRGIWSLLWVEQGSSREAPVHNEVSQARIHDRLTAEIGEAAAGELGQRLLAAAEEQKNRFYTAGRDAEKSTLTEPRENAAQLRRRLEDAVARRDGVAAAADELERQRAAAADLTTRLDAADRRREALRSRHEAAIELGRRLELCDEQVRTAQANLDRCRQDLESVTALTDAAVHLGQQVQDAEAACSAAESNRQAAQRRFDEAAAAAAEVDREHAEQERRVRGLMQQREVGDLRDRCGRLRAQLGDAAAIAERLTTLHRSLAALPSIEAADVERLRQARDARDTARARLEGASASVELEARRDLRVSGEHLAAGTVRRVLVEDEQRLEVEGVVSITVRPGGGELPKLRDAASDAEREWQRRLASLAVADLEAAERAAEHRRELSSEIDRGRADMARHLPQGRDAAEAELRVLETRLDAAGAANGEPASDQVLEQAEQTLRALADRRDELRVRRDTASEQLGTAREEAGGHRAQVKSLQRQRDEVTARRAALADAALLEARVADAERAWRQRVAVRQTLEERFDDIGGEDIELDLEQAERACGQLDHELHQVRERCAALQERLAGAGDDGRHERVQEIEAELVGAETELARLAHQAAVARRLHDVLKEEYERARERLAAPVIRRIRPYLQTLFPAAEVWLDEDLGLKGLRGQDADQRFEALSGGAREQLSLLVRIGLAEVIGTDEPRPLVLDDVLVNTDAERIRCVQRVLFQASRHMQILLFTCHGPMFDGLGADRRIELPPPQRADTAPATRDRVPADHDLPVS